MVRHFVEELEQLKARLLEQSSLVESAIYRSITAVVQKDEQLAHDVLRNEARINSNEIEIDDFAVNLLALQQPMAADLRFIIASIKINNDLERMGDLAVNIAERAISLMDQPIVKPMVDIPHIAALVQSMVRKSLDSFVQRDPDLARSVLASDDAVDDLRSASFHELLSFMEQDPHNIGQAVSLLTVIRNLERIADHATNIAEDVLFLTKGIDVRHHAEAR
jgi:phosphate transport system protein